MALTGHGPALEERRLNSGLQFLPSGRSAFPVPRSSEFHRSINQSLPELWADFSDKGLPEARSGHDAQSVAFHGDFHNSFAGLTKSTSLTGTATSTRRLATHSAKPGIVVFAGFAEFDMDGRVHTAGEMDRLMIHASSSKYPCSRPATLDEYTAKCIHGLPARNTSGREVVFIGPGATGCKLNHTNTLGRQKCIVAPGDEFDEDFDGASGAASLYGRKSIICVYPGERLKRQQSLAQFGVTRNTLGKSGCLRRAGSIAGLEDKTRWTSGDFAGSNHQSQRTARMDQFFR